MLMIIAFGGALLVYVAGKVSGPLRNALAILTALASLVLVAMLYNQSFHLDYYTLPFLGIKLSFRIEPLSWFFGTVVAALGLLSIVFSMRYMQNMERLNFYYFAMLLVNASMLGIVLSADLVSFYVFWEIMSWSTYLLISYKGGKAVPAGLKYMIMSMVGSCAMLLGILSLYVHCGSLQVSQVASVMAQNSIGYNLFILLMFTVAFGIKNAIMPGHTWLPDAHSEAVSPFSAILSSILVRMGVYGFVLVMYGILGMELLHKIGSGHLTFWYILAWISALTIVIPTFMALLQEDSKRLLAWHSVGQGGYMILGIAFGTTLGIAGGIFHTLSYAMSVALLFFVAGAVELRTGGIRELNELGGLAQRMPVTFLAGLIGICGFIGVPLMSSFVSKWMIYKTLIVEQYPFLAFAALIGTWGTILSVFKFLHNIFLGQLPQKFQDVKEVPLSMQIPMIVLGALIVLFGILPGIPLKAIGAIQASMGLPALHTGLYAMPEAVGELNTINIFAVVIVVLMIVYFLFGLPKKARRVDQFDSYGAGSYVPTDKYQYSAHFYERVYELIEPFVRDRVDSFYAWMVEKLEGFFDGFRKIYTGNVNTYAAYIVFMLALLIILKLWGKM